MKNIIITISIILNITLLFVVFFYKTKLNNTQAIAQNMFYSNIGTIYHISSQPICKNCSFLERAYYPQNTQNIIGFGDGTFDIEKIDKFELSIFCPLNKDRYNFLLKTFDKTNFRDSKEDKKFFLLGLQNIKKRCNSFKKQTNGNSHE